VLVLPHVVRLSGRGRELNWSLFLWVCMPFVFLEDLG
jgi:hypothetical protein